MLGLGSVEMAAAFWLTIGISVFCVGYGIAKWNDEGKPDEVGPSDD